MFVNDALFLFLIIFLFLLNCPSLLFFGSGVSPINMNDADWLTDDRQTVTPQVSAK